MKTKKYLMTAVIILGTVMSATALVACGGSDDPQPETPKKATEATFHSGVILSSNTLKFFTVEVTTADGTTTQLTATNTTKAGSFSSGTMANSIVTYLASPALKDGDQLLQYKAADVKAKQFPITCKISVKATPNGTLPADGENVPLIATPYADISNNAADGGYVNIKSKIITTSSLAMNITRYSAFLSAYNSISGSISCTMNKADDIEVNGIKYVLDKKAQ